MIPNHKHTGHMSISMGKGYSPHRQIATAQASQGICTVLIQPLMLAHTKEPAHNKTNKVTCAPQWRLKSALNIQTVFAVCSMGSLDPMFLHADREDWSDWAHVILLVLACCVSKDGTRGSLKHRAKSQALCSGSACTFEGSFATQR